MDTASRSIGAESAGAPAAVNAASDPAPLTTPGTGSPWWKQAVVYQIYPRSFSDSNGDGIGDLRGIIGRLDYLAALGVDVIWLSPVYPSPQDDNGYDISNYQDIDPTFGTLKDFDELLAGIHRRGMKLVMDLVVNHTSDEHPWFVGSRSAADDPRRDWYWWRPARDGMEPGSQGAEPNNWASFFSGSAWAYDEPTGEYYLHLFSGKQPDLNWENPAVRQAIHQMMRWWLDRGVDGFRMDVINMISKDPGLPDGSTLQAGLFGDGSPHFLCGPRIHEFLHELNTEVFADRSDVPMTVGEMPGVTPAEAVLFTDPARREVDMVFQFEHVQLDSGPAGKWDGRPLRLVDLKASLGRWQAALADVGWNSLYWDNHDQPRAVSRFGDDGEFRVESAKLLATVLHLHRGTPYIYQGEELGMTNVPFTGAADFSDIESVNHYAAATAAGADPEVVLAEMRPRSRDNARTPMQWDDGPAAGFTTGEPWFRVNPNYPEINAKAQQGDPQSVLAHFRALITLRHSEPVVVHGDFTMLLPDDEQIYAFTRRWQGATMLVVANFSASPATATVPDADDWAASELVLGNYPEPASSSGLILRPWEARIYRRAR